MSALRRLVPSPLTSAGLLAAWLLLARAPGSVDVVLGLVLALAIPHGFPGLRFADARPRRPLVIARFVLRVCADVVVSNVEIARDTLRWRWRRPSHAFVVIPLELRHPVGLAALAMVTTIVPGTVWSELALDRSAMLLHVWDAPDPSAFAERFKARYERPLREIFE